VQRRIVWLCGEGDKVFACDSEYIMPTYDDDMSGNDACDADMWDDDDIFYSMFVTAIDSVEDGVAYGAAVNTALMTVSKIFKYSGKRR
jgi:hypothetical protein